MDEKLHKRSHIEIDKRYLSKEQIAKSYIKKEIYKLKNIHRSKFDEHILFQSHWRWIDRIVASIDSGDIGIFPNDDHQNCSFTEMLEYPESKMICLNESLCAELKQIHEVLHLNASILRDLYKLGMYQKSYAIIKDIVENIYQFRLTLQELFYEAFSNKEERFFRFVKYMEKQDKNLIVTLFDIKNKTRMRNLYGKDSIDALLFVIEDSLRHILQNYRKDIVLVKADTSNFYMLGVDMDRFEYDSLVDQLLSTINARYHIYNKTIDMDMCCASFELEPGVEYQKDEIVRIMLHLKKASKEIDGVYKVFDDREKSRIREWLSEKYYSINFITKKIDDKEIEMVYQPIISLEEYKIKGVEALARVQDGAKLMPAGLFIDIVYETDKIVDLDSVTLDKIASSKDKLLLVCDKIFINTASDSILNEQYQKKLKRFIDEFGVENVVIEITEQQALKDIQMVKKLYKELYVQFAIDDFGSGYSALKTVADLAMDGVIDVLKIDGTLIKNIDKESHTKKIVEVIVNLCKTIGIKSLAEFVENEESIKILRKLGVDYLQGYYFLPPVKIDDLLDYDLPPP